MEFNVVAVKFVDGENNKKYYFKNHISDLQVKDLVVVHAAGNYQIARVFQIGVEATATKWVVDKINTTMFKLIREGEGQAHQEVSAPPARGFGERVDVRDLQFSELADEEPRGWSPADVRALHEIQQNNEASRVPRRRTTQEIITDPDFSF